MLPGGPLGPGAARPSSLSWLVLSGSGLCALLSRGRHTLTHRPSRCLRRPGRTRGMQTVKNPGQVHQLHIDLKVELNCFSGSGSASNCKDLTACVFKPPSDYSPPTCQKLGVLKPPHGHLSLTSLSITSDGSSWIPAPCGLQRGSLHRWEAALCVSRPRSSLSDS